MTVVIGIDLGTTNSCVAYQNTQGEVQILLNEQGFRTTPSYVTYTKDERLVGHASKLSSVVEINNTVYDAKRLIGRKFSDLQTQEDISKLPYKVTNKDDQPIITINTDKEYYYRPEEVSAVLLSYFKSMAEKAIGQTVDSAVITVPAYFNDAQRQATKDAGTMAGLNVLRIINEPTAAAMAYGISSNSKESKLILVFDLGGGTFDVSLLKASSSIFKVLATAGDTHLGGEDFDNIIVQYLKSEYETKTGANLTNNLKALSKIRHAAEGAKCMLSSSKETIIDLSHIGPHEFNLKLTRVKFNSLCSSLFNKCISPIEKVLKDASYLNTDVDEIVLVGGSSRIVKIQEMLQEFFNGKKLNMTINPDEAVAYGAAVHAASITSQENCHDILLVDVTPLSLGVETLGGVMDVIIPRQKTIPCKVTKSYRTSRDNQTIVTIKIFEGERTLTADNNKLGEFQLTGIPPAPRQMVEIEVTFKLDTNGILSINATELSTGTTIDVTITGSNGHMSAEELQQKIKEAEEYRKKDEEIRNSIKDKTETEEYLENVLESIDKIKNLSEEEKEKLKKMYDEAIAWFNDETIDKMVKNAIIDKRKEWEKVVVECYTAANLRAVQYIKK